MSTGDQPSELLPCRGIRKTLERKSAGALRATAEDIAVRKAVHGRYKTVNLTENERQPHAVNTAITFFQHLASAYASMRIAGAVIAVKYGLNHASA